jgi:hypothetical protein
MTANERGTLVSVFHDHVQAERAIEDLKRVGFTDDQIGIARRGEEGTIERTTTGEAKVGEGALGGALTGGTVGGILGALAAGLIPGIGPVIAGGLLAGILGGAAVGAGAGGLIGALAAMGVPEDEARYYEDELKAGRTIVTVRTEGRYGEAWDVVRQHGAVEREETAPTSGYQPGATTDYQGSGYPAEDATREVGASPSGGERFVPRTVEGASPAEPRPSIGTTGRIPPQRAGEIDLKNIDLNVADEDTEQRRR